MFGIAFELNRPAVANLNQHSATGAATAARGSEPTRNAGCEFNWLFQIRNDLLFGRSATGECERCSRKTNHLDEGPAGDSSARHPCRLDLNKLRRLTVTVLLLKYLPEFFAAHRAFRHPVWAALRGRLSSLE